MYFDKLKTHLKKLNYRSVILVYILLYAIVPIIPRLTSMYLTTYFYMVIVVASLAFMILCCRLDLIRDYLVLLAPFLVYAVLLYLQNGDGPLLAGYNAVLFFFPVSLGFFIIKNEFDEKLMTAVILVAFVVTAVTTAIGCVRNPEAARYLASTKTSQDATAIQYDMQNIGGYDFVYSAVLLYPLAIMAFKIKRLPWWGLLIAIALMLALTVNAEYTYAFLMVMVTTALLLVPRKMTHKQFLLMLVVLVLLAVLLRELVGMTLLRIGMLIGNDTMTQKMTAIFFGDEAMRTLDDNRDFLYQMSWESFCRAPIFGIFWSGSKNIGGHSFILDNLGNYGLFGGLLMLWMYTGIYRVFYRPLEGRVGYSYVFWLFIQPIILSAINTKMWLNNLCLLAPIMLCSIYTSKLYHLDQEKSDLSYSAMLLKAKAKQAENADSPNT